ncbi:hypothetical protein LZC95_19455 [Pendulispora brunnea]|uniref:Uncharacterized protein n=1 Tax=Pendulispora brunnea TaxID=2905690 RepID=A0ABZ2KKB6_9BACT
MARRSETPKLADLTPENVGREMADLVEHFVGRLVFGLAPKLTVVRESDDASNVQWAGELLTHYAQRGLDATDWPDDGCAIDAIQEACSLLYSCAGKPGTFGVGDLLEDGDVEETPIGLVLVGAFARHKLAARKDVTPRELAVLVGMSAANVRLLARNGELKIEDGKIPHADAARWLEARGVPGFGRRGRNANDESQQRRTSMKEVTVKVALHELNDDAKWFVEAAGRQNFGGVNRVVEDVVEVFLRSAGDEEVGILLRSKITMAERARRYGLAGLGRHQSTGEIGLGGEPIPTEEYLKRLDKVWSYESDTQTMRWRVPAEIVGKVSREMITGPDALSQAALELRTFMEVGKFEFPTAA